MSNVDGGAPAGPVTLPYDAMLFEARDPGTPNSHNTGFFPGGVYRYSKSFPAPEEWRGRSITLEFEGVYMRSEVRLNGPLVGGRPSGYAVFHVIARRRASSTAPTTCSRSWRTMTRCRTAAGTPAAASTVRCTCWSGGGFGSSRTASGSRRCRSMAVTPSRDVAIEIVNDSAGTREVDGPPALTSPHR